MEVINNWEFKLSAYRLALSTLGFDTQTIAPKDGSKYRNERHSFLSGEYYNILTDDTIYNRLLKLDKDSSLNKTDKRKVTLYLKNLKDTKSLSKEEYVEYNKLVLDSSDVWEVARENNDYELFEPYLIKLIEYGKKIAKKRNNNINAYELFLDDYEEGMTIQKYDEFFNLIKERIIPLLKKVVQKNSVNKGIIKGVYDIDKQKEFNKIIMNYLGFDESWSYFTTSAHPFTSGISKNDIRITTRYDEKDILYSLYGVIHEVGHGMYEHQNSDEINGTIFNTAITSGIHESQSRLFENYLGRNINFWKSNYHILQDYFPHLKSVNINEFVSSVNSCEPSFIRTEADELTYPLHILVRYEIEKGIFDSSIKTENLNKVWNLKMKQYLNVDVPNDSLGILQDVHWASGSFGYFPAYALGSAYAAQIFNTMKKELNVEDILSNNKFNLINDWLREKIHKFGASLTPQELLINATGEEFNPIYYINYLEDKYSKLYNFEI
ncbi:MAG: carboxypeptidase M32 [Erysipelotrichaceae bacterium]|nr:carboxypeptidase M32 [Erysipelotrichaceae bacterium]